MQTCSEGPLSSEYGTYKTVKARVLPWLSGNSPEHLSSSSNLVRQQLALPVSTNLSLCGRTNLRLFGLTSQTRFSQGARTHLSSSSHLVRQRTLQASSPPTTPALVAPASRLALEPFRNRCSLSAVEFPLRSAAEAERCWRVSGKSPRNLRAALRRVPRQ